MQTLTITEAQKIHNSIFGCDASDRDILNYLKEAQETLLLCREQITQANIEELLVFWFKEEKKESDINFAIRTRLMLDDA
jgi:hypothetical protein